MKDTQNSAEAEIVGDALDAISREVADSMTRFAGMKRVVVIITANVFADEGNNSEAVFTGVFDRPQPSLVEQMLDQMAAMLPESRDDAIAADAATCCGGTGGCSGCFDNPDGDSEDDECCEIGDGCCVGCPLAEDREVPTIARVRPTAAPAIARSVNLDLTGSGRIAVFHPNLLGGVFRAENPVLMSAEVGSTWLTITTDRHPVGTPPRNWFQTPSPAQGANFSTLSKPAFVEDDHVFVPVPVHDRSYRIEGRLQVFSDVVAVSVFACEAFGPMTCLVTAEGNYHFLPEGAALVEG